MLWWHQSFLRYTFSLSKRISQTSNFDPLFACRGSCKTISRISRLQQRIFAVTYMSHKLISSDINRSIYYEDRRTLHITIFRLFLTRNADIGYESKQLAALAARCVELLFYSFLANLDTPRVWTILMLCDSANVNLRLMRNFHDRGHMRTPHLCHRKQ